MLNKGSHTKVFITGMGIISALGNGVEEHLAKLVSCKPGLGAIHHLETRLKTELIAGEIPYSNEELVSISGVKNTRGISRAALAGIIAAKEALQRKTFDDQQERTGFISGTTAEAMTNIELYLQDFLSNNSKNEYIESQDWGFSTEAIASELNIRGLTTTINTACSSAANAIMTGARMIKNGLLDRVLVGGTDVLSKVMLNGFNALMIVDPSPCKPFDQNRKGMNLGEGAAYLVLESEEVASANDILCELKGYGNSNDAYHLTGQSQDGEGMSLAMEKSIKVANLQPADVSYINAHGTGTFNNDLSEARGLLKVFGKNVPPVSSTKPFTGHTLGSSGAVEAVISILAIQRNLIFPNLNFSKSIEGLNILPETKLKTAAEIKYVLSNSFGFGGNNTSLLFAKHTD